VSLTDLKWSMSSTTTPMSVPACSAWLRSSSKRRRSALRL
jgi:hypothetical protein